MKKITSNNLARLCVVLLVMYPVAAYLVWAYVSSGDKHGVLAALLASNAATALLVLLAFNLPEFREHTSKVLRFILSAIAVVCGLFSAMQWMADEVDHLGLRLAFVAPVVVILVVLMWFIDKANKERTEQQQL